MSQKKHPWLAILAGLLVAGSTQAQNSKALIETLVSKGVLTTAEAAKITEDLKTSNLQSVNTRARPVTRLQLSGRMQVQFDGLRTDAPGPNDPPATNHFFVRRAYISTAAAFGESWSTNMTYDMSGNFFDAFVLHYRGWGSTTMDIGIRKVNFGVEERTSSGSLKAIERSAPTRYFVESNNGRRLGAGSYRTGIFIDGSEGGFFWGLALTNPEWTSSASSLGSATNNRFALWGNLGLRGRLDGGSYVVGAGIGFLPDQGGNTLGAGDDLTVISVYANLELGKMALMTEYLYSDNENGAAVGVDSNSWGFVVQPSYRFSPKLEGVVRYGYLDSDGRGVNLSDGVRSAPSGGTMNTMSEAYAGGTYYVLGNDLKFQAGFVWGRSKNTLAGAAAESATYGFRSQMQVNF